MNVGSSEAADVSRLNVQTLSKAQDLDGPLIRRFQELAKEQNIWLSLGGFQVTVLEGMQRPGISLPHVLLDILECQRPAVLILQYI